MWKIENVLIYKEYKFTDKFVMDILNWAIENSNLCSEQDVLTSSFKSSDLEKVAKRFNKLKEYLFIFSNCNEMKKIKYLFETYRKNYTKILIGKFIRMPDISDETKKKIKPAFDYFYDYLLNNKYFWEIYNPQGVFKERSEIRSEMLRYSKTCPYCDKTDMRTLAVTSMDHLLPIDKFPYLSLHYNNIVIACKTCNSIETKSSNCYLPILHPYYHNISDVITFKFNAQDKTVKVYAKKNVKGVCKSKKKGRNFIRTLKLDKTYRDTWDYVDKEDKYIREKISSKYHEYKHESSSFSPTKIIQYALFDEKKNLLENEVKKYPLAKLRLDYCSYFESDPIIMKELRMYFQMEFKDFSKKRARK